MKMYYPIGTTILLNGNDKPFTVIGLNAINVKGEKRDYVAVRYPLGALEGTNYFFFNEEQIETILHKGYESSSHNAYVSLLNSADKMMNKEFDEERKADEK